VREPILDMRSDHTIPIYNYSKHFNVIIDEEYWGKKDPEFPEDLW
jgi:ribosomal protein S19